MNRLADVLNILGAAILASFVIVSGIYGREKLPVWLGPKLVFGMCSLAIFLTIVALAVQRSWGHDKINMKVNRICTILAIIIAFTYLLL